jgi:hypothetical protein
MSRRENSRCPPVTGVAGEMGLQGTRFCSGCLGGWHNKWCYNPSPRTSASCARGETVEEVGEGHQHAVYPLQVLQTSTPAGVTAEADKMITAVVS